MSGALQLRFHFGERDRDGDGPLDVAVMDACARHGVWAAALLRGVEGFGANARMRTERLLSLSEDQPLVAVAVGEAPAIEALAEEVVEIAAEGLLVLEEVEVATAGSPIAAAGAGEPGVGSAADVARATIWGARSGPRSPHLRAVDALHRHGAESAIVLLGVDGVLDGERRRARFVAGNRGVPAMTVAVGERAALAAALAELGPLADFVAFEGVERSSVDDRGKLHGVRVALATSEATQCASGPLYLEFIHALRRGGAPGATALRGVWGFRGDVAPHGDRVLALRRDVPVIVETVDSAERAAKWREVAESLAGGPDVVHSQPVPTIFTLD
ncbi:MAG TPA: DUF190 domain-containing protein [Solirubrobacterales bacterium]|nr:DUF190 domain-containing protein [Solirubrobacterales bacterium]